MKLYEQIKRELNQMRSWRSLAALLVLLLFTGTTAWAQTQISDYIVYQGVAFDDGTAVASTDIALRFTLLESDGTTVVYQETQAGVTTTDKGFFFHQIGSGTRTGGAANYGAITWGDGYKLQVEVDYANGTSYTDIGIRELSSSVYAIRAKTATQLATARTIGGVSFDGTENITLQAASSSLPGVVTTDAQTFAGTKTFEVQPDIPMTTDTTIANTDRLVFADASNNNMLRRSNAAFGTSTTTYLRNDGTWGTPPGITDLGVTAGSAAGPTITSSTGNNVVIPTASASASGAVTTGAQTFAGNKTLTGFTKLGGTGTDVPAIKFKKLTGTTAATDGGFVSISHGLTSSQILSISALVNHSGNAFIPNGYSNTGYEFIINVQTSFINVINVSGNSSLILSKPVKVVIMYEE
jgi:hypothetical protein